MAPRVLSLGCAANRLAAASLGKALDEHVSTILRILEATIADQEMSPTPSTGV